MLTCILNWKHPRNNDRQELDEDTKTGVVECVLEWATKFSSDGEMFVNDRRFIKCPCNRCLNNATHQLEVLKSHIFRYGFMFGYDDWIYHGEGVNVMGILRESELNTERPERDEMHDVLGDLVCDDEEGDP